MLIFNICDYMEESWSAYTFFLMMHEYFFKRHNGGVSFGLCLVNLTIHLSVNGPVSRFTRNCLPKGPFSELVNKLIVENI